MLSALRSLFDSRDFMPHGHCFLWNPVILWLQVGSDLLIGTAYYSLPIALIYFAKKRPDMPFRSMFVMFGAFIMLCGTTHLFAIWVLWHPDYGPEALIKLATAIASFSTAIIAWRIMPQLLSLPSPSQLEVLNEQLRITNREVEEKVGERTAALEEANRKLEASYAEADKANRAKRDFLANMSHEIRTPMNAVVGLAQLLGMPDLPQEKREEFVRTLRWSAESMLALINDLLDIAKIESEYVTLDNVPFNLRQLVEEVTSVLSVQADKKRITLTMHYDDTLGEQFVGDPNRIRQVLMNLVSNAVKFTERGNVDVRVTAEHSALPDVQEACIQITDSGIGIAAEKQEAIFNKFSQADMSITRKYGGSGLGLAISKALTELMGGTINVQSTEGAGSTFTVHLPLAQPSAVEKLQARKSPAALPADAQKQLPPILLVEDYQPNILVATAILEQLGYRCEVAQNGEEALDKISQQPFGLVLMDVQMPLLDGYRATRLIREEEEKRGRPRTPIIGITAHALLGDREKCIAAGMDDYLAKPFKPEELQQKIKALLAA